MVTPGPFLSDATAGRIARLKGDRMAKKPIRVEVTRQAAGYPKGAVLGFESEAKAASILGEGTFKVTAYQDGSTYTPPAPKKPAKDEGK